MQAIGPYQIVKKLGEGGMGVVYMAEDTMLHRPVAIKLIHQHLVNDENLASRFLSEARLTASLLHGNIATLYNLVEHDGQLAMIMEYIEGITLEDLLKQHKPLEEGLASGILMQVLSGLEYAHERGIVHRDIKPSNIMITKSGQVKIMDFGIAQRQGTSRLTQTGKMVGTLHYMAPEQILGHEAVQGSDLYAAGIVLYEMLTGDPPFAGKSDFTLMEAQVKTAPTLQVPALRGKIGKVLQQSLRKKTEQRFSSAQEFRQAIQAVTLPFDTQQIRQVVFERKQEERTAAAHTPAQMTQESPAGAVITKINTLPDWLPKALFGVAALVLAAICLFLFFPSEKGTDVAEDFGGQTEEISSSASALQLSTHNTESVRHETGRNTESSAVDAYLEKARSLYHEEKFLPPGENAIYYCNEVLKLEPRNAEALKMKENIARHFEDAGDKAAKRSDYQAALDFYQKALAANAPDGDISRKIADMEKRLTATSAPPAKPKDNKPASSTSRNSPPPKTDKPQGSTTSSVTPKDEASTSTGSSTHNNKTQTEVPKEEVNTKPPEPKTPSRSVTEVEVPRNTKMIVQLAQTVNSDQVQEGQRIRFTCPSGLTVNGIRIINQGEEAFATITDVRTSEGGDRAGKIGITMDGTRSVTGESIPLYGIFTDVSKSKTAIAFSQGTRFEVSIRSSMTLKGYQ